MIAEISLEFEIVTTLREAANATEKRHFDLMRRKVIRALFTVFQLMAVILVCGMILRRRDTVLMRQCIERAFRYEYGDVKLGFSIIKCTDEEAIFATL